MNKHLKLCLLKLLIQMI